MLKSKGGGVHPCRVPLPTTISGVSPSSVLTTAIWPKYNSDINFLPLQSTPIFLKIFNNLSHLILSNAFSKSTEHTKTF